MQMESTHNHMEMVFGTMETAYLNVWTPWDYLGAPCVVKMTVVSWFHLESLLAFQVFLLKELLEHSLISVTLSKRRRLSGLACVPKQERPIKCSHAHT